MAPLPDVLLSLVHSALRSRSPDTTSPFIAHDALTARSPAASLKPTTDPQFGVGATPAKNFNNKFYLALFALLGAAAALAGIWFFFWAKNGGFQWHKDDWSDYKSTVLRRKGPDGKTLSNATKSTKLGGGSVVHGQRWHKKGEKSLGGSSYGYSEGSLSSFEDPKEEMKEQQRGGGFLGGNRSKHSNNRERDPELAEYRHEKVARVGGLNRQHDGSHFDYSNTGSDVSGRPLVPKNGDKDRKKREKAERAAREKAQKEHMKQLKAESKAAQKAEKTLKKTQGKGTKDIRTQSHDFAASPNTPKRSGPSAAYSFQHGEDQGSSHYTGPSQEGSYYYSSYRPVATASPAASPHNTPQSGHAARYRDRRSESRNRQSTGSPSKTRSQRPYSDHSPSSSDVGTKVYSHHIPGLSKGSSEIGVDESVSQVGARRSHVPSGGFRRSGLGGGGVRRRDSLSDSD